MTVAFLCSMNTNLFLSSSANDIERRTMLQGDVRKEGSRIGIRQQRRIDGHVSSQLYPEY